VRGYLAETLGGLLVTDVAGDAVHITRTLSTAWKPGITDLTSVTATTSDVLLAAETSSSSSSSMCLLRQTVPWTMTNPKTLISANINITV